MSGILFALAGALFIALAQLYLKKSYKELKPSIAFLFDAIFGLLIWVPLALAMGVNTGLSLKEAALFAFISAILSEAIVFYALSHGELAVTATVLATYPAYTVLFSWILNGERLSFWLLVFVGVAVLGSMAASLPEKFKKNDLALHKPLLWPFIASISIALSDTLSKGYINRSNDFSLLFMLGFMQVPVALAYLRVEKEELFHALRATLSKAQTYRFALVGGLLNIVGTGFLWLSFSYAPASIASPITGFSGALTVLFSRIFLHERLSTKKYAAIGVAFIGVLGIILLRP